MSLAEKLRTRRPRIQTKFRMLNVNNSHVVFSTDKPVKLK